MDARIGLFASGCLKEFLGVLFQLKIRYGSDRGTTKLAVVVELVGSLNGCSYITFSMNETCFI